MSSSVVPISSDVFDVGKTIASSKKQHIWRFRMEGKEYSIELFNSVISGKKKILQNKQIIFQNEQYTGAFNFPFNIGRNSLSIVQHGDKYDLRINNQSFSHLYENRMTQQHFKSDQQVKDDIYPGHHGELTEYEKEMKKKEKEKRRAEKQERDEERQMKKVLEMSKRTAEEEKEKREIERAIAESLKLEQEAKQKREENKSSEQNDPFGFESAIAGSSSQPQTNPSDDLLALDMPSSAPQQPVAQSNQPVDLFGAAPVQQQNPAASNGATGFQFEFGNQPQPAQAQQPASNDFFKQPDGLATNQPVSNNVFDFNQPSQPAQQAKPSFDFNNFASSIPQQQQQQQQQQPAQPSFQPNPFNQQQYATSYQQPAQNAYFTGMGQQQQPMGMQQQQPMGMQQQQPIGMQQQPMGMQQQQPMGMQQQPMQQQPAAQQQFDFGTQQQPAQQNNSTPFDMFN